MVLALVGRHTHQPLLVIIGIAAVNGRPGGQEGILGEVLGGVGVADKLQANGIDQFLVLPHQLGKFLVGQGLTPPLQKRFYSLKRKSPPAFCKRAGNF